MGFTWQGEWSPRVFPVIPLDEDRPQDSEGGVAEEREGWAWRRRSAGKDVPHVRSGPQAHLHKTKWAATAVQGLGEQVRVVRQGLERRLGVKMRSSHPVAAWMWSMPRPSSPSMKRESTGAQSRRE